MFAFFIALFGGLFWIYKISNEKSADRKHDMNFRQTMDYRESKKEAFEKKVLDRELEADLEALIYDISNYEVVWEEVSKAFNEMPWKPDDEKFICLRPEDVEATFGKGTYTKKQREQIAANYRKEALRIMMANRGKLLFMDAIFGIPTSGSLAPTNRTGEKWNTEKANLVLWINEKLKKHGIYETVLLKNWSGLNEFYNVTEENKIREGTYYWTPEILVNINLKG